MLIHPTPCALTESKLLAFFAKDSQDRVVEVGVCKGANKTMSNVLQHQSNQNAKAFLAHTKNKASLTEANCIHNKMLALDCV